MKKSKSANNLRIKIKLLLWSIVRNTLFKYSLHPFSKFRIFLLKLFGAKIGVNCFIHPSVFIYKPWNFEMGSSSAIDFETIIRSSGKVKIGDFVSIGYKTNINTGSHDYNDVNFKLITKPILIQDGVFIGTESYISLGVTIEKMCVIGARSVVTKDMPTYMVCVGHPCKPIKQRKLNNDKE